MQYESIEVIIQDSENGTIYNVSNIVKKIDTSKPIDSSAGKCQLVLDINVNKIKINMGSTVSFKVKQNGKTYGKFFGYVFSVSPENNGNDLNITAYDQLRYLKNNESYVLTGMTLQSLIRLIGNNFQLRLGTIEGNNYILPERVEDNKALGDIIQRAIDFTLQGTATQYIIRDEFGYLCCRNVAKLVTNVIIGDNSLLKSYSFKEDIDNDTYNAIKLYKDNEDTGKREVYIAKDSNNQKRWGVLQMYQSLDENYTDAQAREKASQMLSLYNRVQRTLTLECKGVLDLEPGSGVRLNITSIPGKVLNQNALITKIEDTYQNGIHTMKLEVMFE